jgi:hypothetical protein
MTLTHEQMNRLDPRLNVSGLALAKQYMLYGIEVADMVLESAYMAYYAGVITRCSFEWIMLSRFATLALFSFLKSGGLTMSAIPNIVTGLLLPLGFLYKWHRVRQGDASPPPPRPEPTPAEKVEALKTLGLEKPPNTPDELKTAWRRTTLRTHPDKEGGSKEAFEAASDAYEILKKQFPRTIVW